VKNLTTVYGQELIRFLTVSRKAPGLQLADEVDVGVDGLPAAVAIKTQLLEELEFRGARNRLAVQTEGFGSRDAFFAASGLSQLGLKEVVLVRQELATIYTTHRNDHL